MNQGKVQFDLHKMNLVYSLSFLAPNQKISESLGVRQPFIVLQNTSALSDIKLKCG